MPYVGRDLQRGNYLKLDDISSSFNGSTTTFNLTSGGNAFFPGSAFSIIVSLGGVIQEPESAFQIDRSQIIFATAPSPNDDFFCIVQGVSLGVGVPGHNTVNNDHLAKPLSYGDYFRWDSANNRVGINTLLPSTALDVVGDATFSGNVAIGGTLTYEDVANIDAVGIITARAGIEDKTLTAGRVVYTGTAGRLVDNSALTFNPTTLNTPGLNVVGVSTFAGNVTIVKTAGPLLELTTNTGAADATLRLSEGSTGSTTNGGGMVYSGADNKLHITCGTDSTTKRITILRDNGKVGINSTVPTNSLDINAAAGVGIRLRNATTNNSVYFTSEASDKTVFNVGGGSGSFAFFTGGSEKLTLTNAGNLGISTTVPAERLSVAVPGNQRQNIAKFEHYGQQNFFIQGQWGSTDIGGANGTLLYGSGTVALRAATSGNAHLVNLANGNIGIGTDNPTYKLHVDSGDAAIGLWKSRRSSGSYIEYAVGADGAALGYIGAGGQIISSAGADSGDFAIRSQGDLLFSSGGSVERLRIDSSGRMMIGSTAVGRAGANSFTISGSDDTGMTIRSGTSHEGNIYFSDGSSGGNEESRGIFRFDHSNDSFQFFTASGNNFSQERLRITSGGNVLCGGTAVSQTNRQLALGSNAEANFAIETHNNATSESSNIRFYKSRGTAASPTAVADNHYISQLMFYGHDGTDYANPAGYMRVLVDGTVANNQVPGQLQFGVNDGSSATTAMTIHKTGSVLFSGLTDKNDPRNAEGIAIKSASGISFQNFGANGSRNWRIRPDDMVGWGTLEFSVSPTANSSTDWPDAASDVVLTLHPDKNVSIGNGSYGSSLGQLRIINDAATGSGAPASLSLFGYNNTTTGTVFAKIDFASQEGGTGGQVTAGIEAQAVGTAERAADIVFKTRPDTSGSSAIERVRIDSDGATTISGVPSYGAISKTASSSTYVDIFVYDTRKDSDGGAWRHRTNNTSWYNETLNTSIRGARREFPQVAIIAVGTSFLQIFDADDPDVPMWMEFPAPSGGARNVMYGPGNPRCVYMLNGILCTGSQAANYWPVLIDFIRDDILGLRSATGHNHYHGRQGNISLRNSATSDNAYWWPDTVANGASQNGRIAKRWWFDGTIVDKFVTSVVMSVRPEAPIDKTTGMQIPTIYLGTRSGVSIIHSNVGDIGTSYNSGVYDITSNNGPYSAVGDITITEEGFLWFLCDSYNSFATYRDSCVIDLKRLDNQMNDIVTRPDSDTIVSGLNNQGGGGVNKGREFYWVSTGNEGGSHKIGYSNTWAATIVERNAWGCATGFALHKKSIYTYDHKESSNFLVRSHENRGLVAMITKDYNTGWHMTGNVISSCYITQGLTSNISAGSGAMLDFGHHLRNLDVTGTLTRAACATGSDLSCVSGFSSSNYARITNANLNAGNPINMTFMGWIKLTDISGYSYLCSIANGSDAMGIAVHASDSSYGGKPYFYDSTHGALRADKGVNDGEWHHICGVFSCSSNRKILYVDGVRSSGTTAPSNVNYSDLDTIAVGHWCGGNGTEVSHSCAGSLALVKLGQTDLTDQQIKRIYEDEKKLFQPNAKAFLYGSSNSVTAIGYDEKKEIYHVGTSSGRSDFSGLSRINNTTTAVTTAISAYDGLIAEQ